MKSYFEDPRVTLYVDIGGALLSYLHRTHVIDSISAESANAMEAELKRKNPEVWKAIQYKIKNEDKWKPILDKRGKRKRWK
jgi:5-hydroxyisourate hydrolase-like protein (transthyretin family)